MEFADNAIMLIIQIKGCIIIIVSLVCSNGAILVYDITDEDSFFKVW